MSMLHRLKNPALVAFLQDQHLPELFRHRVFRLTEAFLRRQLLPPLPGDEIQQLDLTLHNGYALVRGVVKKSLLPAIPFSFRLQVLGVEFNAMAKRLHLSIDELQPLDIDWVTRRVVERLPFLEYGAGRVTVDLERVPRLATPLQARVKGVRIADYFTIKELQLRPGEVVGRLGVSL